MATVITNRSNFKGEVLNKANSLPLSVTKVGEDKYEATVEGNPALKGEGTTESDAIWACKEAIKQSFLNNDLSEKLEHQSFF